MPCTTTIAQHPKCDSQLQELTITLVIARFGKRANSLLWCPTIVKSEGTEASKTQDLFQTLAHRMSLGIGRNAYAEVNDWFYDKASVLNFSRLLLCEGRGVC